MASPRTPEENKFLFSHFTAMEKLLSSVKLDSPSSLKALVELTQHPITALSSEIQNIKTPMLQLFN